jgi:hypothetical protein
MLRDATVTLSICTLLLAGCSTVPKNTSLRPIPLGSEILVVVHVPGIVPPDAKDASEAIGDGASAHAAKGFREGASSGFEGSFEACNVFFFVCAPVFAIAGGVVGAAVGGVVGSVHGANIALPEDKADALGTLIQNYLESEHISANLLNEFNRQQNGRWQVVDSETGVVVTLGVETLRFAQFPNDELSIRLTSNLVVRYGPETTDATKRMLLNAESEQHHVDYWTANEGANLKMSLNAVFAENSRQVIAVLSQFLERAHPRDNIFGLPVSTRGANGADSVRGAFARHLSPHGRLISLILDSRFMADSSP